MFVLLLGLAITAAATLYVRAAVRTAREESFASAREDVLGGIEQRMEAYTSALRGARGLIGRASEKVTQAEFRDYVTSLELQTHYPGIQGIGYAELIPKEALAAREAQERAAGRPLFQVWPRGERPLYTAVTLLEPQDWRNQRALGFDMYSEPSRREAMERAARTGQPAASGKLVLVQEVEADRQFGFLLYLPVYEHVPGGRDLLRGWVYAPFRARDLFHGIFRSAASREVVDFEIYDGAVMDTEHLLYDDDEVPRVNEHQAELSSERELWVAGRQWKIFISSRPGFEPAVSRYTHRYVFGAGLLITLLLVVITRDQIRTRAQAEEEAWRSAFLAEATAVLTSTLNEQETLERLTRLCVPVLADWCAAEMENEDGVIRPAATAHLNSTEAAWAMELRRRLPLKPDGPLARAVREGKASLVPVVTDEMLARWAMDAEFLAALKRSRFRSYLCVPLTSRGRTLGALTFVAGKPGRLGERELSLAQELAVRAAAAVDNARLYQQSQEAIRLREDFLSIAAHEFKTPLTSLNLNVQMLKRQRPAEGAERFSRSVEMIERQVGRLGNLVNQLLDVTRAARGRLQLGREEVELSQLVRDVVARTAVDLGKAQCPLELSAPAPVVGLWDRLGLEQVVTNLLSNAIKYGPGRPIRIAIGSDGARARLEVRDEGIGISPGDLKRVFDRFERAVPTQHYGGLGLGLYITRQIIEALGGTIRVESLPGEGALFTVELPLQPEREEAEGEGGGGNGGGPDGGGPDGGGSAPAPEGPRA